MFDPKCFKYIYKNAVNIAPVKNSVLKIGPTNLNYIPLGPRGGDNSVIVAPWWDAAFYKTMQYPCLGVTACRQSSASVSHTHCSPSVFRARALYSGWLSVVILIYIITILWVPGLLGTVSARPLLQADLPECLFHADLGKFNWELIFVTKKILLMFCAQLQL